MARLHKPGERDTDELIPDFEWIQRVTLLVSYDPDTDTVLIDRGSLGRTLAVAVLNKAVEDLNFTDEVLDDADEVEAETED